MLHFSFLSSSSESDSMDEIDNDITKNVVTYDFSADEVIDPKPKKQNSRKRPAKNDPTKSKKPRNTYGFVLLQD